MANLKPCPFCGKPAWVYVKEGEVERVPLTEELPKNARLCQTVTLPSGYGWCEIRKKIYIPRCSNVDCIGWMDKHYSSEAKAVEAWNRRAGDDS